MPHATEDDDDQLISQVLGSGVPGGEGGEFMNFESRDLDVGEKADDAEDYEDIGSDDLGDLDEDGDEVVRSSATKDHRQHTTNGQKEARTHENIPQDDDDPFADLFGSADDQEGIDGHQDSSGTLRDPSFKTENNVSFDSITADQPSFEESQQKSDEPELPEEDDPETLEQYRLFEEARVEREERTRRIEQGEASGLPPAPQTDDDVFYTVWPQFEPHKPPKFGQLLPGRRAYYLSRKPLKQPRPVQPTKISLELQQDQEKLFKLPGLATSTLASRLAEAEAKGLILAALGETVGESDSEDDGEQLQIDESDEEDVGGVKWNDIVAVCQDWSIPEDIDLSDAESPSINGQVNGDMNDMIMENGAGSDAEDDLFHELPIQPSKKRKRLEIPDLSNSILPSARLASAMLDNPEKATARLAKRVRLDLNDPHMLVDLEDPTAAKPQKQTRMGFQRSGGITRDLARRYNISNDEAYDLLKENHQNKVRSNLANVALEHALPAIKLQYPFYKVKLSAKEARAFHRPNMLLAATGIVHFDKLGFKKRKHLKGKEPHEIFASTSDLSVADNSNVVLMEYSEEYPNIMSNFGMANKILNYYRRKDEQDTSRPKYELGETSVLVAQDKSPFSIFGDVKPGETVPTLHNGMYRAPVFRHSTKPTDFLLVSTRTGIDGRRWFLRNLENLHVVGQEFPSVEIPGTHSRKVTDAAKKRLRMLSFRMFSRHGRLKNEMILRHLPGSDIAQNRSKMREFMEYDKDRGWLPKKGSAVPEEANLRTWIKPEDLCLLEAMQVGDRQLQDAGYTKDNEGEEIDDDDEKTVQSLDQQLAPWQTSKNFLMACQGKAFVAVHGEGDPTGRGEGYNLVRTSMKGGYREIGESIEDKLDAKRIKELGGHQYNVARQHKAYTEALQRVWDAQKRSLESNVEHDDSDMGGVEDAEINRLRSPSVANPRSARGDDAATNITSHTNASQIERILRVTRKGIDKYGHAFSTQEIIRDPTVIREYKRRRNEKLVDSMSLEQLKRTGDAELDELIMKKLKEERDRIKRNQERRHARNKAKGRPLDAGSPYDGASPDADGDEDDEEGTPNPKRKSIVGGTQRKCANCGQVGHIKTNKKLCPMLNGTIKQGEGFGDSAFGSAPTPTPTQQTAPSPAFGTG